MELILWRHAEAEDGVPDGERALTKKGQRQAAAMAAWLRERLPKRVSVLASPATRAQQTAAAFAEKFTTLREIGVGATAAEVVRSAGWPEAGGTVIVVGHQPTLGRVAALLVSGAEAEWPIRKGAVWWLAHRTRDGSAQVVLRAVLAPDLL
jgi:phosphohistidine phosphatase